MGEPRVIGDILFAPDYGLDRQAWQPRLQRHGTVNVDGFGVGWWAGAPSRPVRYRRDVPIWSDPSIIEIAGATASEAVVAAVRSATTGTASGVEAAAPFGDGRVLFSHNGRIEQWPDGVGELVADVEPHELLHLVARTDSAVLWLLVQRELAAGRSPEKALAAVAMAAADCSPGRYNFLLHDGEQIVATAFGDTLFVRETASGTTVASEPTDDDSAWNAIPDRSVVVATRRAVFVTPIEGFVP